MGEGDKKDDEQIEMDEAPGIIQVFSHLPTCLEVYCNVQTKWNTHYTAFHMKSAFNVLIHY